MHLRLHLSYFISFYRGSLYFQILSVASRLFSFLLLDSGEFDHTSLTKSYSGKPACTQPIIVMTAAQVHVVSYCEEAWNPEPPAGNLRCHEL